MLLRSWTAVVWAVVCGAGLVAMAVAPPARAVGGTVAAGCAATVWRSGAGGYHTYRIPAVVAVGGTLVAFAEARRNSASDDGDIAVVERRSADRGCTWSEQTVVADDGRATVGNPVPLVTRSGTLVLLTNRQGAGLTQAQILAGRPGAERGRRVFVQTSGDAGRTWSARREITAAVKKPHWLWYVTGPGHGLTLTRGPVAGRLVAAAAHTARGRLAGAHLLLSDDDGRTWRIGADDDHRDTSVRPAETATAQLPDGWLYVTGRDQGGTAPGNRLFTYSRDSGASFTHPLRPLPSLVTPAVEGALLQDPGSAGLPCAPLLYSGPQDPSVRRHLTVRRSPDGGLTWHTLADVTGPAVPAGYSDLVKTAPARLGVLYETGATTRTSASTSALSA